MSFCAKQLKMTRYIQLFLINHFGMGPIRIVKLRYNAKFTQNKSIFINLPIH